MRELTKCPVCGGNGLVPNGFYSTTSQYEEGSLTWVSYSTEPETCRPCAGKGYVRILPAIVLGEKKKRPDLIISDD